MTLRVGVNLTWIAPGRVGGSEEYLVRQLLGLPADGSVAVELYCSPAFARAHPVVSDRWPAHATPFGGDNRAMRIALEHTWLAAVSRHADVVHHAGGTVPLVGRRPVVLTVHDLQYLDHPDHFSSGRRRYLATMMPRSARRAAVITTPSEFVRRSVIDAFGADPDRVVVVPHGIPEIEAPTAEMTAGARERYGIGARPFAVYPAITHPHKRHDVLVAMLTALAADPADDTVLVLLGGRGRGEDRLRAAVERSPARERVLRPGRVPDRDRDALLAGADALVFPSEFEGFGAPLVEAMELGTPVVCSHAAAVREVVGDAAVVVDEVAPDRAGEAWADALAVARSRRAELVARGHVRRRAFTLETSGAALHRAYRLAAEVGGRG